MRIRTVLSILALCSSSSALATTGLTQIGSISCTYGQCGDAMGARFKNAGRYLYVEVAGTGLNVFDIRNPGSPVLLTTATSLKQGGDVIESGRYLYLVSGGGIQVADAKDPTAPILVGQVTFPSPSATLSAISGKYVYAGLNVVDVSDPTAPIVVGSLPVSGPGTPNGIAISGTNAYVTDDSGRVHILDISDPKAATEMGYLDLGEPAYDIAISGTYAYVVTHGWYCDDEGCTRIPGHLQVLDISGPSCARLVTSIGRPKGAEGIVVSGGYAYLSEKSCTFYTYQDELTVVDISNPSAPFDVAYTGNTGNSLSAAFGYGIQGVAVIGNTAFVTTPWNLFVYNAYTSSQQLQCQ
jgi:hypothetical protein